MHMAVRESERKATYVQLLKNIYSADLRLKKERAFLFRLILSDRFFVLMHRSHMHTHTRSFFFIRLIMIIIITRLSTLCEFSIIKHIRAYEKRKKRNSRKKSERRAFNLIHLEFLCFVFLLFLLIYKGFFIFSRLFFSLLTFQFSS